MSQLTLRQKMFYGMGGLAMSLPDMVFTQWIFVRYVKDEQNALAPAAWFGICVLVARVIGALAEPAIGHWSDNFFSPRGRRMPFVRRGMLPFAITFLLLWHPPIDHMHWLNGAYALVLMLAYLLCFPTVLTPYLALMPEMTADLRERVTLTTLQAVFIMLGSIAFALMGVILDNFGWTIFGGIVSLLLLLSLLPIALTVHETPRVKTQESISLWASIRMTVANRPFRFLAVGTSFFLFAFTTAVMSLPFWVKEYLHLDASAVTMLMAPLLGTTMVLFAGVGPVVSRYGKHRVFLASLLGAAVCLVLWACVGYSPVGSPFQQLFAIVALMGVPITGFTVLPFALLGDVIDYDEKLTGRRREAIFFAVQGTLQKCFVGLAGLAFSVMAYWGPGNNVTVEGLRMAMIAAAISALIGFVVFLFYPLREREGRVICLEPYKRSD